MKKHLLALAALATLSSVAAAQSATVYGIIDLSVSKTSKVNGTDSITALTDAVWMPSVFGITGSEDLGGGLKASFNLESDINADTGSLSAASGASNANLTGTKLFGRKANVGLSGSFGSLTLGKDIDMIFLQGFVDNIRNSHSASGFMAHALKDYVWADDLAYVNTQNVFLQNMVKYSTPTYNGLSATVQHSFGEVAGQNSTNKSTGFLVNYAANGLTLAAGTKKVTDVFAQAPYNWGLGIDSTLTYLGGTYTTGPYKIAATYHKTKWEGQGYNDETKTTEVGAAYTINPKLVAAVNYVHQKDNWATNNSANITSASLKYSLSKRTNLWTLVSRTDNKDGLVLGGNYATGVNTTGKSNSYSLGVTHSF